MAITFEVSRVKRATAPPAMEQERAVLRLQHWRVEAMGANAPRFRPVHGNALVAAVHTAYARHYPLTLSPDAIWLAIAQGFAQHVNANAERLRGKFVRHAGRVEIAVRRDDFVKGSRDNPWPEAFAAFSDAIAGHIGRQRDLVVCDFSTTGPCERAASEIVLMDAMQQYFDYAMYTLCGIPEITLEGTLEDWRSIRRRARALEEYELSWWTDALGPVLDQLVATAEGHVDTRFWQTLFKHTDGSGGPWVGGWINVLLPYVRPRDGQRLVRNERMAAWRQTFDAAMAGGAQASEIPSGLACAPFQWHHLDQVFPMHLLGGFVGIAQDEGTLAVRPAIGWAVRDAVTEAGGVSREQRAADRFLGRQASGSRCPTLLAGWLASASLTVVEAEELFERIAQIGRAERVQLTCVVLGRVADSEELTYARVPVRFLVGAVTVQGGGGSRLFLGIDDLRKAVLAMRDLPRKLRRSLEELVPGGIGAAPALFLYSGTLRFASSSREGDSFVVASAEGEPVVMDLSPEAHEARVATARRLGLRDSSIPYLLRE